MLLALSPACAAGIAEPSPAQGPAPASASASRDVEVVRAEIAGEEEGYPSSLYVERDVKLSARTTGVIEKVLVDRGAKVSSGQALAELETDLATRQLEMADQEARLAAAEYDRMKALSDHSVVSPQDFLRAEIQRDKTASAAALARAVLERCTVRAPFDGVVVERWAVAGQRVVEDDGTPLFRVVAREPLRARIDLPEKLSRGIAPGAAAVIQPSGGRATPARIVFVSPAVDAGSGTLPVIVEAPADAPGLRLGESVRVRLGTGPHDLSAPVFVPRDAIRVAEPREGDEVTLLVVKEGRAAARKVTVLAARGALLLVRGEVGPEDDIILSAGARIAEGDLVRPRGGRP